MHSFARHEEGVTKLVWQSSPGRAVWTAANKGSNTELGFVCPNGTRADREIEGGARLSRAWLVACSNDQRCQHLFICLIHIEWVHEDLIVALRGPQSTRHTTNEVSAVVPERQPSSKDN